MMSNKTIFGLLVVEVLICFLPTIALWAFGVCAMVIFAFSGFMAIVSLLISCLVILGGVGLLGVFQVLKHIYKSGFQPADDAIHTKLYAGIITLTIVDLFILFSSRISLESLVFILPVICGIHLVYLTRTGKTQTTNSVFNDQIT